MRAFDFQPRPRVLFGEGEAERLGELAREYGAQRVLLVSDHGVAAAGHVERAQQALAQERMQVTTFVDVEENPTTAHVAAGVEAARAGSVDFIVGLGGGSAIDCAKGINFIYTNGGRMADYRGSGKAAKAMLPMIALPTTAGTGSEAQSYAIISDAETHEKMACGDAKAACVAAILDPLLTLTMPPRVTAVTGLDAISHALESHVSTRASAMSKVFSEEAWRLLSSHYDAALKQPDAIEARGGMLLGAFLAGWAIENAMLGAAHACANPLTARYGVTHGIAVGVMLPHVIRYNMPVAEPEYFELFEIETTDGLPPSCGNALADEVEGWFGVSGLPHRLRECGVEQSALASLAADAAKQWTAQFNPRPVSERDLQELYECAW